MKTFLKHTLTTLAKFSISGARENHDKAADNDSAMRDAFFRLTDAPLYNAIGRGTSESPYLLFNAMQLADLAMTVNAGNPMKGIFFEMKNDINLSYLCGSTPQGCSCWMPIGISMKNHCFAGTFDGGGHRVSGLFMDTPLSHRSLFGPTTTAAVIRNLSVYGSVAGDFFVGGITSFNRGLISHCNSFVKVYGTDNSVGGIAGFNGGIIEHCSNNLTVSGRSEVGGIVGRIGLDGVLTDCKNMGMVNGHSIVGGVTGINIGSISGCFNMGAVSGVLDYSAGGIAGVNNLGTISDSYSTGAVVGSHTTDDIVGVSDGDTIFPHTCAKSF